MFDLGISEILVVFVVALLVIGPERLPEVARTAGRYFGKFRAMISGVKQDLNAELQSTELKALIAEQEDQISRLRTVVTETRQQMNNSLEQADSDVGQSVESADAANKPDH